MGNTTNDNYIWNIYLSKNNIFDRSLLFLIVYMLITAIVFFSLYGTHVTKALSKPVTPFKIFFQNFFVAIISFICIAIIGLLLPINNGSPKIDPILLKENTLLLFIKLIPSIIGKELLIFSILFIVINFLINFFDYKKAIIGGTIVTVTIIVLFESIFQSWHSLQGLLFSYVWQIILIWASFRSNSLWISICLAYALAFLDIVGLLLL